MSDQTPAGEDHAVNVTEQLGPDLSELNRMMEFMSRIAEGKGKDAPYKQPWDDLSLSDSEIVTCVRERPVVLHGELWTRPIYHLCPDAAVKAGHLGSEYLASELVRTATTIPVPRVHRIIPVETDPGFSYMVMQWVKGRTLDRCWGELGVWRKMQIAWTLRGYVRQLRRIPNSVPGKVGPLGTNNKLWLGPFFGERGAGPFDGYDSMVAWLNSRLKLAKRNGTASIKTPQFDTSYRIVFTHHDLRPENLLLDDSNRLWMIDFGESGFYPEPFEYVAMLSTWRGLPALGSESVVRLFVGIVSGFYNSYYDTMFAAMKWILWNGYAVEE